MLKTELAAKASEKIGIAKTKMPQIVDTILDTIKEALKEGNSITLVGFGTFKIIDRSERKARNPRTGEEITIPAKKALVFKASKAVVEQLNKNTGE